MIKFARRTFWNWMGDRKIVQEAIHLAWPVVIQNLLNSLMFVVDALMLGAVGGYALAAHGIASPAAWTLLSVLMAVSIGTQAMVSRFLGNQNPLKSRQAASAGIWLGLIVSITGCLVLVPLLNEFVSLFHDPETMDVAVFIEAAGYMQFVVVVLPLSLTRLVITAALRGAGDTKTPMVVTVLGILSNIVLNVLFIFGLRSSAGYLIPPLGVWGAGFATSLSISLESLLLISHMFGPYSVVPLQVHDLFSTTTRMFKSLIKISLPATVEPMVRHSAFQLFVWFVTRIGQNALATNRVLIAVESTAFMAAAGVQRSAATMVGQSLGMGSVDRAVQSQRVNSRIVFLYSMLLSLVFLIFPEYLVAIFSTNEQIIELGAVCLRIAAIEQLFLQQAMVFKGCLQGAGDTRSPLWITGVGSWLVRVPFSAFFALEFTLPIAEVEVGLGWGLTGIWVATTLDWAVKLILYRYIFKQRGWKDVQI